VAIIYPEDDTIMFLRNTVDHIWCHNPEYCHMGCAMAQELAYGLSP